MSRRLIVLIFTLAAVGQAFAGVCICDDSDRMPPCCRKAKIENQDYLTRKGCCEGQGCWRQDGDASATGIGQAAIISDHSTSTSPGVLEFTTSRLYSIDPVRSPVAAGRYRYRPRAPELYVRHHAFLI